jgi:hypothetical protein
MLALVELQEQLLAQEEELSSREGSIFSWEDGLTAIERALGRACMEHDAERSQTEVVRQDFLTMSRTLTTSSKHSINFNRMLVEC